MMGIRKNDMTQDQINQIVKVINDKLKYAKPRIEALDEVCDEDYLLGRKTYPITAIVYSAFNTEEQPISGFEIQKVLYGGIRKLYLPELFNDEMMIEVFGDTSNPCSTDQVKKKLHLLGDRLHLLIFSINQEEFTLSKLQLLSLNGYDDKGNAKISDRKTLYKIQ